MSAAKIRNDATESTRATIYQLCIAILKCYEMSEGQKLLIEELGDVTIEGEQQIEVKQYKDCLTDGHYNFWNTLKNWLDDGFDHTQYSSLILHTTQKFGAMATIAAWNNIDVDKRLKILHAIKARSEKKFTNDKAADPNLVPSSGLKLQQFVLDSQRSGKLKSLVEKVWIEAAASELPDLYTQLQQNRVRGILSGKKDDYMNSLIGFVCRPNMKAGDHWEISYEEFEAKIADLNTTYCKETRIFPRKHFYPHTHKKTDSDARDDLFVKKIQEIEYSEVICKAIHDYEATIMTIDQEFKEYAVDPATVEGYASDVETRFSIDYRAACRKCSDEISDSKDLYDRTTGISAPTLPGFGDTPDGFRNGLLHQRMDNPDTDIKWRLSKNE